MHTKSTAAILGALLAAFVVAAPAAHAQDAAAPDPAAAEQARFVDSLAPRSLAEFAGHWGTTTSSLTLAPDGSGTAEWLTFKTPITDPVPDVGHATVRFTRVEGRTAFGTVSDSTDRRLPNGPVTLTEYGYGIGSLVNARGVGLDNSRRPPTAEEQVCGPRYVDPPEWLRQYGPCGA